MRVERLGAIDNDGRELRVQFLEDGFGEPRPDVTDGLVSIGGAVVAGEQECTVPGRSFALAVIGAENHEVERVTYARQVVFLDLDDSTLVLCEEIEAV